MEPNNIHTMEPNNVHKIETLLDDDEDENAPAAEDVDAFAAVLKGDLGDAAGHGAAAATGSSADTRSGNGTVQPLPQSPASSVSTGQPVSGQPAGGQAVGGQPVGGHTVGGQTVGGHTGGQTVGGQAVGGQTVSGHTGGGQTGGGHTVGGQTLGGHTGGGQSVGGHTVSGQTVGGLTVSGQMVSKPLSMGPGPQQQLLWSQLSPDQQREVMQRRVIQQQQQQRLQQKFQQLPQHQFQQLQQSQQQQNQPQQQESGSTTSSSSSGSRKTMLREGISFTALMPLLQPHLPPEQGQQLSALYHRFKMPPDLETMIERNEITREDFIRGARVIAGDQVLVQTIRQMHLKQQAQLQQQQLLQQKLQQQQQQPQLQQQPQTQLQPQHLQSHSSHGQDSLQQIPQNAAATSATPTVPEASKQQQQQQQQSQESMNAVQQSLPMQQMSQPLAQTQEPTVTNAAKMKLPLLHTQAHPFQQPQVPSNVDRSTLPQGSQPQSHLPSSLPSTQAQSLSVKQGDIQDPGQGQVPNHNSVTPMALMQVKHEVDKSLGSVQPVKQQHLPAVTFPSMQSLAPTSSSHPLQTTMMTAAVQQTQPYIQTGLPQQPIPGQVPLHVQLPQAQTQPGAQAPGPVTLPQPPQQLQPQLEKPLTKYAKQKLRKEQKKREEEEKRKQMEEENLKKAQATPSGVVTTVHQGLHPQHTTPQLASPPVELNKQSYSHHPGSLSQQVQLQTPVPHVDKQQVVPITPGGLLATGQGQSLVPVKQEPSDLQSEQKRQAFQFLSDGQAGQKPAGQTHLTDASVLPANNVNHVPVQGSNVDQVQMLPQQGSMALPSPNTAPSSSQQAGMATMPAPGVVPNTVLGGSSGLHSTLPIKQVVGQQRAGSISLVQPPTTTAYNTASLLPVTSFNSAVPLAVGPVAGHNIQSAANLATTANKTPTKKPAVGIKKAADSTPAQQLPSKKQKVSAGEPDQSIDQLNDVTAVSGVNLKEEEEQLLAGPKEEGRTTEAMRKILQEEEDRLFLEKAALQTRVASIASRWGIKSVSEDVGRCLSMSVEERLRSMLYKVVKLSKQRCDVERDRHKIMGTTDIRRQILLLKKKAKELLDKKLAEESDRLRKLNEKKDKGSLPEVEREELKAKAQKAQQEEDDRMKANAANVAARAAVGADDMLLKWQMMAEQGRQKRQGETGAAEDNTANRAGSSAEGGGGLHSDKKLENGDSAAVGPGNADAEFQGPPSASTGRPPGSGSGASRMISGRRALKSARGERSVTVRDIIAFLETETQMSKSTLLYRLYERERRDGEKKGLSGSRK